MKKSAPAEKLRGYRNRAIVYVLIETGMRRAAVTKIDIDDVNFQRRIILVEKKGGLAHAYQISREGIDAIRDYLEHERAGDFDKWKIPALFLSAHESAKSIGKSRYFSVSAFNRLKSLFSIL